VRPGARTHHPGEGNAASVQPFLPSREVQIKGSGQVPAPPQAALWPGEGPKLRCGRCRKRMQRNQPRTDTPQPAARRSHTRRRPILAARTRDLLLQAEGPRPAAGGKNRRTLKGCSRTSGPGRETPAPTISQRRQATRRHESWRSWSSARFSRVSQAVLGLWGR